MKRNEFIKRLGTLAVAGVPLISLASSCSSGDDEPSIPDCLANGTVVSIGANHGHTLEVSKEDVEAGIEKTYVLGGGTHGHQVTVSAAAFATLKDKLTVATSSDNNGTGHTHSVRITCV